KSTTVVGLPFREQEPGSLVGSLAGLYAKDNGGSVSSVCGQKIPPVDHYIAGFQAGAKKAKTSGKTLNGYSQSFTDQAKCKEIALDQIAKGSKVVFQVAGSCGLGAIDAAKEESMQAIGVDADQSYLGPQIITSALKKVDVAVFDAIKTVQDNTYKGGGDVTASLKTNGVGIGKISAAGQKYAAQVKDIQQQILDGSITPPDTVGSGTWGRGGDTPANGRGTRAARHPETLRAHRRQRRRGLRPARRRGPRPPRRERRGQVDALVDPLRALPPGGGRDDRARRAGADRLAAAGHRPHGQAGGTR